MAIHAAAHITGGGLPENLPRALPEGLRAVLDPRLVGAAARRSTRCSPPAGFDEDEAWSTFNMGLGMCVVVAPADVDAAIAASADARLVGRVEAGPRRAWRVAEGRCGWWCWSRAADPTCRA